MKPGSEKAMLEMNNTIIYGKEFCNKEVEQLDRLDTIASGVFYAIQCLLVIPTIYVNILVLRMLKRDKFSIAVELKINSFGNIAVSIMSIFNQGIIKFAFPACHHLGSWYCHMSAILMAIGMFREAIHSLTLSIYRYVFIIYRERIQTEKDRIRASWLIFFIKWIAVITFALKLVVFNKDEFVMYFSSLCKGKIEKKSESVSNQTVLEFLEERSFFRVSQEDNSVLITNFGKVDGNFAIILKSFCVIVDILIVGATLNLLEGLLYSRIANFMKR